MEHTITEYRKIATTLSREVLDLKLQVDELQSKVMELEQKLVDRDEVVASATHLLSSYFTVSA